MLSVRGFFEKGVVKIKEKVPGDISRKTPVIITFLEDIESLGLEEAGQEFSDGKAGNYFFSDLAGKLKWDGDPVEQQRAIRDEW